MEDMLSGKLSVSHNSSAKSRLEERLSTIGEEKEEITNRDEIQKLHDCKYYILLNL